MMARIKAERPDMLHPADTAREAACRMALQPLDRRMIEIERRWGSSERLARLASPETAAKFGSAEHKLQEAIREGDPDLVAAKASVLQRGLDALEREAEAAGHSPSTKVWHVIERDRAYVICLDHMDARAAAQEFPDATCVTAEELIRILYETKEGVFARHTKELFPGAVVARVGSPEISGDKQKIDWRRGDELPDF
jgi:hypothetical protein